MSTNKTIFGVPGYIDEPILIEEDNDVDIRETVKVVGGIPYIEYGD